MVVSLMRTCMVVVAVKWLVLLLGRFCVSTVNLGCVCNGFL